jgi:hypothetical protein
VDGEVLEVETSKHCVVQGEAYRIRIRVNALGTYTARSPVEGRIMDLRSKVEELGAECPTNALWIETDEGDSVVLQFHDYLVNVLARETVALTFGWHVSPSCLCLLRAKYMSNRGRR